MTTSAPARIAFAASSPDHTPPVAASDSGSWLRSSPIQRRRSPSSEGDERSSRETASRRTTSMSGSCMRENSTRPWAPAARRRRAMFAGAVRNGGSFTATGTALASTIEPTAST